MKGRLLLALLLVPYLLNLGEPDLWDANETLYAEPPREALETGRWLAPTMNYETWFVKPPGVTWVLMPFYAVLGPTELAARLPIALAAALTILLTADIARRAAGARAALLAAAVLATTVKSFFFARQLAGDVFLVTCFTAAAWGYLRWLDSGGERRGGLWLGSAALGLAVLMKGPVGLLLPGLGLAAHRMLVRGGPRLRLAGPLALALLIGVPWFVYMVVRFGDDFIRVYFLNHHLARVFTEKYGAGRGAGFYPLAYLGDALPWSVALPAAIVAAFRDGRHGAWRRDPRTLPLLWIALVFVVFTLSTGKRSVYLLPVYPAAAVVLAVTVERCTARCAAWMLWPVLGALLAGLAASVWIATLRPDFVPFCIGVAVVLLGGAAALALCALRRRAVAGIAVTAAAVWLLGVWSVLHFGALQRYRPARPFAERIAAEAAPGDIAGRFHVDLQSLTFYGRRPFFSVRDREALLQRCRSAPRAWVVLPEERRAVLEEDPGLRVAVVDARPYLKISLPALRGRKPLEQTLLLVRVTPAP